MKILLISEHLQVLCMKGRGGTVWQTLANRIIAPRAPHIIQEKAANNKKSEVASKIQKSTWKKLLFLKWKIAQRSDFEIQIQTSWASREAGPAHRTYFLKAAMAEKKQNVNIYTWSNLSSINSTSLSLSISWSYTPPPPHQYNQRLDVCRPVESLSLTLFVFHLSYTPLTTITTIIIVVFVIIFVVVPSCVTTGASLRSHQIWVQSRLCWSPKGALRHWSSHQIGQHQRLR